MADLDTLQDLLGDTDETTDAYAKRRMEESKKYKVAKPGDPGVVSFDLSDEPADKTAKAARSAKLKAKALKETK